MILSKVRDFRRYEGLNCRFGALADALEAGNLRNLEPGRHEILGEELYVVASPCAVTRPNSLLEVHRRYIDVHIVLDGDDTIGWAPLDSLREQAEVYDSELDRANFVDPLTSIHLVTPGHLAVFFPEDAHAPLLGDGRLVHKCVFKVLAESDTD